MMLFMKLARKNTKKKKKIQLISTVNRYLTYCETKTKVNDIMIKPNVGWGGGKERESIYRMLWQHQSRWVARLMVTVVHFNDLYLFCWGCSCLYKKKENVKVFRMYFYIAALFKKKKKKQRYGWFSFQANLKAVNFAAQFSFNHFIQHHLISLQAPLCHTPFLFSSLLGLQFKSEERGELFRHDSDFYTVLAWQPDANTIYFYFNTWNFLVFGFKSQTWKEVLYLKSSEMRGLVNLFHCPRC